MTQSKEKAAIPIPSVGADGEQPPSNYDTMIIPTEAQESNDNFEGCTSLDTPVWDGIGEPGFMAAYSMQELYDTVFPAKTPLIEHLLYPGTYLLVGAPKYGKSYLVLQMAYHISKGLPFWGHTVTQGTVLYLALEDDFPRLQARLYQMFSTEVSPELFLAISANTIDTGLDEQIKRFVSKHANTKLIVIDTLQKIRSDAGDQFSYAQDYKVISTVKALADSIKAQRPVHEAECQCGSAVAGAWCPVHKYPDTRRQEDSPLSGTGGFVTIRVDGDAL